MRLIIRDLIEGDRAMTFDLGVKVRESFVCSNWNDEPLVFDFAGIQNVTASFLAQIASPVLEKFGLTGLRERIAFESVPSTFDLAWKKVLDAAKAKAA